MDDKYKQFQKLVEELETAMLTTRRPDGLLVSRPMATQAFADGADLWFVTAKGSPKLAEIAANPEVNLAYYKDRTREWISVAGNARIVEDRAKIHELHRPDWKAWFEDRGGAEDGGPDDPRLVLIAVDIRIVHYLELNKPQAVILFEIAKGIITGKQPDMPPVQSIERQP